MNDIHTPFNLSLIICVIGMLIYLLVPNSRPKEARVGELMFGIGLFVYLFCAK